MERVVEVVIGVCEVLRLTVVVVICGLGVVVRVVESEKQEVSERLSIMAQAPISVRVATDRVFRPLVEVS